MREKEGTIMFVALKRIYSKTKDETYLVNAVARGFITEDEKAEIIAAVA